MSFSEQQGLIKEAANLILAGPSSGSAAFPTFRSLVAADLPAGANIIVATVASTGNTTTQSGNLRVGGVVAPAGVYRVTLYMVVTGSPAAGNLDASIGWNDGTAARTATNGTNGMPADISTAATNFAQGSTILKADGVNDITYAITKS